MQTHEPTNEPTRSAAKRLAPLAVAGLLLAAVAFSASPGAGRSASFGGGPALSAQAAAPAPISVELLTARAAMPDSVTMSLNIGLQGGEPIEMTITEPGLTVVAKITVQPGAMFPWHSHPGPVLVNVAEGELVYIPANDCLERHYPAGSAFFDPGRGNAHTAYNASAGVTILIATFFEVPAEGPLTLTEGIVAPAGCNVEVGEHSH